LWDAIVVTLADKKMVVLSHQRRSVEKSLETVASHPKSSHEFSLDQNN